jgi:hypothetical protein
MLHHICPSSIEKWLAIPETKILLQNWLLGKDNVGKVNYLSNTHRGTSMISQLREVINATVSTY